MCPKDADRMAKSVDPDQTAPYLDLHYLPKPVWKLKIIMVLLKYKRSSKLQIWLAVLHAVQGV